MRHGAKHPGSERARQHNVLLQRAFARAGVREMFETYRHWHKLDRYVDLWRRAVTSATMEFSKGRGDGAEFTTG